MVRNSDEDLDENELAKAIELLADKVGDLGFADAVGREKMGIGERGVLALESIAEAINNLANTLSVIEF